MSAKPCLPADAQPPPRHFRLVAASAKAGAKHVAIGNRRETLCGRPVEFTDRYGLTADQAISHADCVTCKRSIKP